MGGQDNEHAVVVAPRVIKPTRGWRALDVRELWRYRELLAVLTIRDLKVRYKQTVLGAAWAILQPVISMVIFSVIFGRFGKMPSDELPYPIFVYAGMLPWTFFAAMLTGASNSMINSGHLISKVYFPRLIIPLSQVGTALVDFVIASTVLFGLMLYYDVGLTWGVLLSPVMVAGTIFCAIGAGTLLSGLSVRYRDFRYVIPFAVQILMYASPVIYPPSMIPEQYRFVVFLNPMAGFIDGFRAAFLGQAFDWGHIGLSFVVAAVLFGAGITVFSRLERYVADLV